MVISVFVALVAGSALRPFYSANVLPEPSAWTHANSDAHHGAVSGRRGDATVTVRYADMRGAAPSGPTSSKPFRFVWMTRDVPTGGAVLPPESISTQLPVSFGLPIHLSAPERATDSTALVDRHRPPLFSIIRS